MIDIALLLLWLDTKIVSTLTYIFNDDVINYKDSYDRLYKNI